MREVRVRLGRAEAERGAQVEYQTRLIGWDPQWSPFSPARETRFSALPAQVHLASDPELTWLRNPVMAEIGDEAEAAGNSFEIVAIAPA